MLETGDCEQCGTESSSLDYDKPTNIRINLKNDKADVLLHRSVHIVTVNLNIVLRKFPPRMTTKHATQA